MYVMGGLINSSTVKGDLWMIEAGGSLSCYPLATTAEGPGPRVGHASLLVGNAFIVYGGDTKIEENDVLDETLYLLNTCKFASAATSLKRQLGHVSVLILFLFKRLDNGQELYLQGRDPRDDTATLSTYLDPRSIFLAVKSRAFL